VIIGAVQITIILKKRNATPQQRKNKLLFILYIIYFDHSFIVFDYEKKLFLIAIQLFKKNK